jgi:hypothetical protein
LTYLYLVNSAPAQPHVAAGRVFYHRTFTVNRNDVRGAETWRELPPQHRARSGCSCEGSAHRKMGSSDPAGIVRITAKRRHWTTNVERLCGTELAPLGKSGGTV